MTERLSELLRDEAREIPVPHAPASAVLGRGRAVRRRRRVTAGAASAAAVLVVVAGSVVVGNQLRGPAEPEPVTGSYAELGALAVDGELYVAGRHVALDEPITSLHYTSEGVVVRSATSPDDDRYTLVRGDGSVEPLDLGVGDGLVATEPDSPRLASVAPAGKDRWDVVVTDVDSGEEVARHTVDASFPRGLRWSAPPVALAGDLVWVYFDGGWTEVDWRSGQVRGVPGAEQAFQVGGGRYAEQGSEAVPWTLRAREDLPWTLRAMEDGHVLARLVLDEEAYGSFSPDGRYFRVWDMTAAFGNEVEPYVYDLETGQRSPVPEGHSPVSKGDDLGWTPDGHLLALTGDGAVQTCAVGEGCEDTGLVVDLDFDSEVRLGGGLFER
jgi:hypothetical protein